MKLKTVGEFSLDVSTVSDAILINGASPLSIQPTVDNLMGSPTYTLQVSNDEDEDHFMDYDITTTNVPFSKFIQIDYAVLPWKYIRIATNSAIGDSGSATFKIFLNEKS